MAGVRFFAVALLIEMIAGTNADEAKFEKLMTVASFVSPSRMLVRMVSRQQPDTYLYHYD